MTEVTVWYMRESCFTAPHGDERSNITQYFKGGPNVEPGSSDL